MSITPVVTMGKFGKLNELTFVFRADASLRIGTGHVMRCLTLADTLREDYGAQCHFLCRAHPGNLIKFIEQRGYIAHALPVSENFAETIEDERTQGSKPYKNWLGATQDVDASVTANILALIQPAWVIVDHYALDARWETLQRRHSTGIMVIDDLANRQHVCDVLLDQNFGRSQDDYTNLVPKTCKICIGPQYALLRPEFAALRHYSVNRRTNPTFNSILISMGGVDEHNATGRILDALTSYSLPTDLTIKVVMGPHAPWLDSVRKQALTMPYNIEVLSNVHTMAQLMADSDLAIGAAGSTSWERCVLALPTLLTVLADNQRETAKKLAIAGVVKLLDIHASSFRADLHRHISEISTNSSMLHSMANYSKEICDGLGRLRVIDALINK